MATRSRRALLVGMASTVLTLGALVVQAAEESPLAAAAKAAPAAMVVGQMNAAYTVTAIDAANRGLTLKTPDNSEISCIVGKDVRNFDQIKVGDRINVTLVGELAVFVGKAGMQPTAGETITLAPKGARPGMLMTRTDQMTARILGIDQDKRLITLEGPRGNCKTIAVGRDINLADLKKGDDVTVQWSRALAISVQPPSAMEAMPAAARVSPETERPGMPAAIAACEAKADFMVRSVDQANRTLTLQAPDGSICTCTAGKAVRNFDQIKAGDEIRALMVDEMAVSVRKAGAAPVAGAADMVALAPKGDKPGMFMVKSDEISAKILGIDTGKRMITLEGPGGKDKIIKAAPNVNLAELAKGDDVVVQWTQALAVDVQAPEGDISARPAGAIMKPGEMPKSDEMMKPGEMIKPDKPD